MYTFYSSNILYIMFISCEYARRYTTHWTESETLLLMWTDMWQMSDCFGLKVVYYEGKGEGEDNSTPYVHCHGLREET